MKNSWKWLFLAGVANLFSCNKSTNPGDLNSTVNMPVMTSVPNSYTYSVNANNFSNESRNNLSFSSDSLVVTLTTVSFVSGTAIIAVKDSLGSSVFVDTVRSNTTLAYAPTKLSIPKTCNIVLTNFSANLVFTLVGK